MSYKITHQRMDQQLRFPNRAAAERYAEHDGGGHENWAIINVQNPTRSSSTYIVAIDPSAARWPAMMNQHGLDRRIKQVSSGSDLWRAIARTAPPWKVVIDGPTAVLWDTRDKRPVGTFDGTWVPGIARYLNAMEPRPDSPSPNYCGSSVDTATYPASRTKHINY